MTGPFYIELKWGTIKNWGNAAGEPLDLLRKWGSLGYSESAMLQHDTAEQKEIICQLIDLADGGIFNEWTRRFMTAEEAKTYVRTYGRGAST
jgi:hypothetical protein